MLNLDQDLDAEWERFKDKHNFTYFESFISNSQNPIYSQLSDDYRELIQSNNNIDVPNYISGADDTNGNYCPTTILGNGILPESKLLKWAQIFYGVTFALMSMALLHFYDVHRLLGPLAISIALMMRDLSKFLLILAVFLVPYGVTTTALLYPNEVRFSEGMQGIFFKPILTLYGELFLSEYTAYDFNDPLGGCAKTSDIRKDINLSTNYTGFQFAHETIFYKNMTKDWNNVRKRDLSECFENDQFITELAAYYMVNYDCKIVSKRQISCSFYDEDKKVSVDKTLSEIFNSICFESVRLIRVERPQNGYPSQEEYDQILDGELRLTLIITN